MLSRSELREVYDRVGTWQDAQSFYEAPAVERMIRQGAFARASSILEIGCGTGHLAARLLRHECPPNTRYRAIELSSGMAGIARRRLQPFAHRATVHVTGGAPPLATERGPLADASTDRTVSAYVLDLMPKSDVDALLEECRRVLRPAGRLCICGLAPGATWGTKAVTRLWRAVHRAAPRLVGGCRPLSVAPRLDRAAWTVLHRSLVSAWGIASEVLVARPRED